MLRLIDLIFVFCASLKLAVVIILSIAGLLAIATFYEAHYGAAAVGARVYSSPLFLFVMALLSINVMAAALIRYPWKRKQTGFVITHIGIEILLLGCLISYRKSIDGRLTILEGKTGEVIDLQTEQIGVAWGGKTAVVPVRFWDEAGYPSILRYAGGLVKELPDRPTWKPGLAAGRDIADGVRVEVTDWLPAAKPSRKLVEAETAGRPGVALSVVGTTPMGMAVDEPGILHSATEDAAIHSFFGGILECALWRARSADEVEEFLTTPKVEDLGTMGRLTVFVGGQKYRVKVDGNIGKAVTLGNGGYSVSIDEYLPQIRIENGQAVKSGDEPESPVLKVRLTTPAGVSQHQISAKYPFLPTRMGGGHANFHGGDPVFMYDHPAMFTKSADRTRTMGRGRLQLVQSRNGELYARLFGLDGLKVARQVNVGETIPAWMGLSIRVDQHVPLARLEDGFVPAQVATSKLNEASKAAKIAVVVDGQRFESWVSRSAPPVEVETPKGKFSLSYNFDPYRLPFSVTLLSAKQTNDPNSLSAAAYESKVLVTDSAGKRTQHTITMNNPLTVDGLTFYQSGFDDKIAGVPVSFLGVRYDPGWPIKYAGCGLIVLGIFTMFYMKAYFQKPVGVGAMKSRGVSVLAGNQERDAPATAASVILLFFLILSPFAGAVEYVNPDALRSLPVMDHGRLKPIDSVAREAIRFVTGRESLDKLDPLVLAIDFSARPTEWEKQPVLYCPLIELRKKMGMPESQKWIAPKDVRANVEFRKWTDGLIALALAAEKSGEEVRFTRIEEAGRELRERLAAFDALVDLKLYPVVPVPNTPTWATLHDLLGATEETKAKPLIDGWKRVIDAHLSGNTADFAAAVGQVRKSLEEISPTSAADRAIIDREVYYNHIKPFRLVWIAYLLAVAGMVGSLLLKNRWFYRLGFTLFLAAIGLHIAGFALRCSITGWAPVTNMYETVIWVALLTSLFALVLESVYRPRTIAIGGAVVACISTIIADVMPPEYGSAIRNLAPVLRSNYWLTIHVLTIVSSYAAFALAMVLGNIALVQYLRKTPGEKMRPLIQYIYRATQIGVLLVAAGTILGGLWADVSWGRFWGWDPKEVWALIILLTYLALLHGRMAGWIGNFGLAAGSVICWTTVLMSWYGVNFVLGVGLHAYGFGTGGQAYIGTYVALQLVFVILVWCIHGRRTKLSGVQGLQETDRAEPAVPSSVIS